MTASQHTIAGTVITMPVQIRKANQHMAMFSVDADAAQHLIDYTGLRVCRYLPRRAVAVLMLMHYIDGDLGQYYEFGTSVMVNPPGAPPDSKRGGHEPCSRPVPSSITCPSTRRSRLRRETKIWGYPKVMADFTIREGRQFGFDCSIDGQLVIGMDFRPGLPIRLTPRQQAQRSYSHRDGVTRETAFEHTLDGVRTRLGGVRVRLGDHPYAKELASLGLPKRAMLSSSADQVQMTFGDAQEIS